MAWSKTRPPQLCHQALTSNTTIASITYPPDCPNTPCPAPSPYPPAPDPVTAAPSPATFTRTRIRTATAWPPRTLASPPWRSITRSTVTPFRAQETEASPWSPVSTRALPPYLWTRLATTASGSPQRSPAAAMIRSASLVPPPGLG